MKFQVYVEDLKNALSAASLATTTESGVITSSVLFRPEGERMMLWATDRRSLVRVPMPVLGMDERKAFTVEAARLSQWVATLKEDTIDVTVTGAEVTMQSGSFTGYFASLDPNSFADFSARIANPKRLFEISSKTFHDMLKFGRQYIGESTTNNPTANNLQVMELIGGSLFASDSFLLSRYSVESADLSGYVDNKTEDRFKVAKDEVRKIMAFLKATSVGNCTVSKADLFMVESDDGSLFAYPNMSYSLDFLKSLPLDFSVPDVISFQRDDLASAVNSLVATANPEDTRMALTLSGEGDGATLTLTMKNSTGKHTSKASIGVHRGESSGGDVSWAVNYKHFLKPLTTYVSSTVTLGVAVEGSNPVLRFREVLPNGDTQISLVVLAT